MTSTLQENFAEEFRVNTVDEYIFDGLQQRFLELFNVPTAWVSSTDEVRILDKLFPDTNKSTARYPYAFLRLSSGEVVDDRGNNRALAIRGIPIAQSTNGTTYLYARLLPVSFTVAVKFVSNNFQQIANFGRRWSLASKTGKLSFQVEYGLTSLDIRIVADTNLAFPSRDASPENIQEYMAEANLTILGFVSEHEVRRGQIANQVSVDLGLAGQSGVGSTSFWHFIPPSPSQPEDDYLLLEDDSNLLLEDSSNFLVE